MLTRSKRPGSNFPGRISWVIIVQGETIKGWWFGEQKSGGCCHRRFNRRQFHRGKLSRGDYSEVIVLGEFHSGQFSGGKLFRGKYPDTISNLCQVLHIFILLYKRNWTCKTKHVCCALTRCKFMLRFLKKILLIF